MLVDEATDPGGSTDPQGTETPGATSKDASAATGGRGEAEIRFAKMEGDISDLREQVGQMTDGVNALVTVIKEDKEQSEAKAAKPPSSEELDAQYRKLAEQYDTTPGLIRLVAESNKQMREDFATALSTLEQRAASRDALDGFKKETGEKLGSAEARSAFNSWILLNHPEFTDPANQGIREATFETIEKMRLGPEEALQHVLLKAKVAEYDKMLAGVPDDQKEAVRQRQLAARDAFVEAEKARSEALQAPDKGYLDGDSESDKGPYKQRWAREAARLFPGAIPPGGQAGSRR